MKNLGLRYWKYLLILVVIISACKTEPKLVNPSKDARVLGVSILRNDSSPNASLAVFTINQTDSLIFNQDSLPYGTRIDSLYVQFTFGSTNGFIINDTVPEAPSVSIHYSSYASNSGMTSRHVDFTKPVKIKNFATDGKTSQSYTIELRVHKVETYLHTWTELQKNVATTASENQKAVLLNGKFYYFFDYGTKNSLYTSTDASNWVSASAINGLPLGAKLRNILVFGDKMMLLHNGNEIYTSTNGTDWTKETLNADTDYNYQALLFTFKDKVWAAAQHKTDNTVRIVSSTDGVNWTFAEKRAFTNFPVDNFAATRFKPAIGREKVIVIGGKDANGNILSTRWSAENIMGVDTLYWVNLQHKTYRLNPVQDAGIAYYGSKLLLLGGSPGYNEIGDTIVQLRQSIDQGLTWIKPDTLQNRLPANYTFRTNASIIHDEKDKSMYIVGGKSKNGSLSDVWKVKVNFYNFIDYAEDPTKY